MSCRSPVLGRPACRGAISWTLACLQGFTAGSQEIVVAESSTREWNLLYSKGSSTKRGVGSAAVPNLPHPPDPSKGAGAVPAGRAGRSAGLFPKDTLARLPTTALSLGVPGDIPWGILAVTLPTRPSPHAPAPSLEFEDGGLPFGPRTLTNSSLCWGREGQDQSVFGVCSLSGSGLPGAGAPWGLGLQTQGKRRSHWPDR